MKQPSIDQLQPTGDWFIVEPLADPGETADGGIIVASSYSDVKYGRVISVGPGGYQNGVVVPPRVQVSDVIMFRKERGVKMRFNGEDVLFLNERDLYAKVTT